MNCERMHASQTQVKTENNRQVFGIRQVSSWKFAHFRERRDCMFCSQRPAIAKITDFAECCSVSSTTNESGSSRASVGRCIVLAGTDDRDPLFATQVRDDFSHRGQPCIPGSTVSQHCAQKPHPTDRPLGALAPPTALSDCPTWRESRSGLALSDVSGQIASCPARKCFSTVRDGFPPTLRSSITGVVTNVLDDVQGHTSLACSHS